MALEMMIQTYNKVKKYFFILILIFFSTSIFSQNQWVIAAKKFENQRGKSNSVTDGITEMFPTRILEKLGSNLYRTVSKSEIDDKEIDKLKKERTSLFLQLSGLIKKRDSLVTGNYSKKELEQKIQEEEKQISEIKQKIDENLLKQKQLENFTESENQNNLSSEENSFMKFLNDLFLDEKENETENLAKVTLYKNDFNTLFIPSKQASSDGIKSVLFENEIKNEKINGLITGKISIYGDYYSITVELYLFPGAELAATVTEVGSFAEADLVSSLIARELTPAITNSLPVQLKFKIEPAEIDKKVQIFIDNEVAKTVNGEIKIDAGVHKIQLVCQGYEPVTTSYSFSGNKTYNIDVKMQISREQNIKLCLPENITGSIYLHGNGNLIDENNQTSITINNKKILGIFISETNEKAFFVIPENQLDKGNKMTLNVNAFDRSQNIEKHRRRMYNSYSGLLTSLIPTFFTMGQADNYNYLYSQGTLPDSKNGIRTGWNVAQYVSTGITIGCGIWFIYELVNYFIAADEVLPVEAITEPQQIKLDEVKTENIIENEDKLENIEKNGVKK